MTRTALPPVPPPGRPGLLADLRDAQTYRTALYVGLALPLGALGAGLLLGGVLAGVVTLPLLIGAGLLLGTLWLVPGLADVQRRVARLLGLHLVLQHRAPAGPLPPGGVGGWLRATLADGATYRALMFHLLQLPLAALCWVVVGVLLAASVLGLAAPWWAAGSLPVSWGGGEVTLSAPGVVGLMLAGAGGLLVTGGVLNLLGRVWAWLAFALLSVPQDGASARREVVALRRAAGRVALGDDLGATLADLAGQARAASTAAAVALTAPDGTLRTVSGPSDPALHGPGPLPPPGGADVRPLPGGGTLATLPVVAGGEGGGTLRAVYAAGTRPGGDELAFLLSIADHAGTALHAAELIARAGERGGELERARLARELHDSVAQALYGITLGAKTARATLDRDPARARESLDYTIRLAEGGVSEMKALLFSLRPEALEEGGLVAALAQTAHALEARHGLTVHADTPEEPALAPHAQAAAYRVAQEALHNVVKHARAHEVWLSVRGEGATVRLEVRDDGRGFDPAMLPGGTLGQRSMRERAREAGGELTVRSEPGAGTTVTLTLPAAPPEEA